MVLSQNIAQYIYNSLIRGKLCRWNKTTVTVFITPITAHVSNKDFYYNKISQAIDSWNSILKNIGINIFFQEISTTQQADIIIHWVQAGIVYEGMCKYLSVIGTSINKISIDIGLPNAFGKETTDLSIFCAIMHEFGHALGLGHGVEPDDIMFVPHQKNISKPSENDIFVLKQIYC